jgi:hypothetical protein
MRTCTQTGIDPAKASKLADLRAKTDRDLAFLLHRASERGFWLVQRNDCEEAEAVYARSSALLPLLKELAPQELTTLRSRFQDLRLQLDEAGCADARLAS